MKNYEDRIEALISQMTLEEKVGQLQQCGPSLVGAFEVSFEELLDMMFDGRISEAEFGRLMSTAQEDFHEEDLRAGRVGSYNGIKNAATANRLQKIAVEETRLGIPLIFGYDVIHGYRTITPIPLAESCAWDDDLWQRTARMAAKEATAAGVHMTFAPMVDVAKDARWGRISEGAGEDTMIAARYGAAKVRGFQGEDLTCEDSMVACVKHFAAYGAVEAGKDYSRVDLSMQRLREEYLPPFKACVDAGARSLMPAFNDISGVPCSVNSWLLKDVLRGEWGFDGMLVSDANAIAECVNHGIAQDKKDAARQALEAGLNMDMTSNSYSEHMVELVDEGTVSMETLDEAVRGILRVKMEAGLFDNPYQTSEERETASLVTAENRVLAREAAAKSMVLLKNEGILPLKKETRLGIIGTLAQEGAEMTGAWAIGADGNDCVSLIAACEAREISYRYEDGLLSTEAATSSAKGPGIDREAFNKLAEESDILLLAIGERKDMSGEAASRSDITLPKDQQALFDHAVTLGKPVVVLLFNGRPLAVPELAEKADVILECWHPGIEAGNAILDLLLGEVNPSGKLTTTFPYATGQCPIYYNHINTGRPEGKGKFTSKYLDTPLEPVYPFGYGLSYTSFQYENLEAEFTAEKLVVRVEVSNTGSCRGDETVQCYVQDVTAKRVRPVKELVAYQKVSLEAGEKQTVTLEIPKEQLGYYDQYMEYLVEPGLFRIFAGGSSVDCLQVEVTL